MSLPEGWTVSKLGDIVSSKKGKKPKQLTIEKLENTVPYIDIRAFEKGEIRQYADIESSVLVEEKDILLVWDGARSGLIGSNISGALGSTLVKINTIHAEKQYLFYFLKFKFHDINKNTKGTGIPHVNPKYLWDLDLPLPPLPEQKQIAKKLDKLLARVERIKIALDNAPATIKRFRQSVLSSAVGGELSSKNTIRKKLTLNDVAIVATGNTPLKSEKLFYEDGTIPWLTSSVTGQDYVTKTNSYVTQKAIDDCKLKIFEAGTLLVAMYGEGKTRGQITELTFSASINQACAAIIVDENKIEKSYLKIRLLENYAKIRQLAEGGNQPNLNLSKVRSIPILVPTREEQKAIVKKVETLFAIADKMEANIAETQKRVDRLTQSILAKAFLGELK